LVLVDDADYEIFSRYSWRIMLGTGYVYTRIWIGEHCRPQYHQIDLHRAIRGNPKGKWVDHRNHNLLDNRKRNLRVCTPGQNNQNRRKMKALPTTSKFKGVFWRKDKSRWVGIIRVNGSFLTRHFREETKAAQWYNEQARKHFKEFACLNPV
jgi:hypothetical protein